VVFYYVLIAWYNLVSLVLKLTEPILFIKNINITIKVLHPKGFIIKLMDCG